MQKRNILLKGAYKLRFVDYKCNDCGKISEIVIRNKEDKIKCNNCGSANMARVFSSFSCNGSNTNCSGSCSSCSAKCN